MIVTIHQPEHMPWGGYFHKMSQADVYVLLDTVQFKKNNWQNRNRIIDRDGTVQWLTVPIKLKGHISSTIQETAINNNDPWQRKYWGRLHGAYCKHPFYKKYATELESIVQGKQTNIAQLNFDLIEFFRKHLGIVNKMLWSSSLKSEGRQTELLTNICKELGATDYLSGPDGGAYMNMDLFKNAGIDVSFHLFSPPTYKARYFEPGLSTLDLLMNHGEKSASILGIKP